MHKKNNINPSIVVLGAGRWGSNIAKTLYEQKVLHAIVDANTDIHLSLKHKFPDIPIYTSFSSELAQQISGVAIATPPHTHHDLAKQALEYNLHVFVEKPMCLNSQEAENLQKLAQQSSKVFMVGHLLLYQPAIQFIKEFLQQNKLGKIRSVYQVRRHLGPIETNSVLHALGVHDLAVLLYLFGQDEITEFSSRTQNISSPNTADSVMANIKFGADLEAHLHSTWLWPHKDRSTTIIGEQGMLHFDELKQSVSFTPYHFENGKLLSEEAQMVFQNKEPPLRLEMQHFIDCIINQQKPNSPVEQGAAVIKLLENLIG